MSAVLKKREKRAFIEEQEKQANAAALEPVQRQVGITTKTSRISEDEQNEKGGSQAYRRLQDPRLGGAIFND